MDSRPRPARLVALPLLVVGLALALVLGGCGFFDKGAEARKAADAFATALQKGDVQSVDFTQSFRIASYQSSVPGNGVMPVTPSEWAGSSPSSR